MKLFLVLDNVRSVHNVGTIFRTADAVGVEKIFCVGITPTPIDRFGRKRRDFAKSALGSEETVAWESTNDGAELLLRLKKEGSQIVVLEQSLQAVHYTKLSSKELPTVLVVGNEVEGVSPEMLALADIVADIPMKGQKESLNVAVATGIALYRFLE